MASRLFSPSALKLGVLSGALLGGASYIGFQNVNASDEGLHPPSYPWNHLLPWQSLDHASIRRGFLVYNQIGKACHSMNLIHFRNLINVCLTEDEAKALAEEAEYPDSPDDTGDPRTRKGKLADTLPNPYPNVQAARYANNGALPPDLSLIARARESGPDYVFSLLTGYRDPPPGVAPKEGLYYNPYFPGGWIAMPPPLANGAIDFDDGTDNNISQMAKDVTTFLLWAGEPEFDDRKKMGVKFLSFLTLAMGFTWYVKKQKWSVVKNRVIKWI